MPPAATIRTRANPVNFLVLIAVVAVLYFTRDVCIPFVLAILVTFVLSPVVRLIQKRLRFPRVLAVFLVVGAALAIFISGAWLVGGQLVSLAEKLPAYQANVHEKMKSFHTSPGGVIDRVNHTIDSYSHELEGIGSDGPATDGDSAPAASQSAARSESAAATATAPATLTTDTNPATQPIPVAIVRTAPPSKLGVFETLLSGVMGPVTTFFIVMILALFMLIRHEDVRDRAIRLLSGGQWKVATQALDDAGARVSRYLLVQLIVNLTFGVCICLGLTVIGIPYALLWGFAAACLRFVPYFGGPMAAIPPLVMGFAAMPGWGAVIWTLILFAGLEITIANFIAPWLYGSSTKISPLAIIASAIFWSWLWGPVGLLLSTPMTVVLVVIGQHVPPLWFLNVLLGDEPVLTPDVRFYQRLLATDQAEAWEIAEQKLQESSLAQLYDQVVLPGMVLAEEDRHANTLDEAREKYIFQSIRDLLEDLGQRPAAAPLPVTAEDGKAVVTERASIGVDGAGDQEGEDHGPVAAIGKIPSDAMPSILCIPANDEADEMGALMLSQLLAQRGIEAEVVSYKTLAGEVLEIVKQRRARLVCVSAVPPHALRHARYLCKRLRGRFPDLKIFAGVWHSETQALDETLPQELADGTEKNLAAAADKIIAMASLEKFRTDARPSPVVAR